MITITVLQRDRSEAIEGVIATYAANDDDWRAVLSSVMLAQEEISRSNGMELWWEFEPEGSDWSPASPDDLQPCIHGYEEGGDYVVTLDVRHTARVPRVSHAQL